ncbi:MAG: hypothetical protein IPJ65_42925 [Archangiaceae bacterium]|nr:hypothetical protein [Archangiaceae bacterium]MBK7865244.1 hypothetical protein [Archangiaceae bacterium]
MTPPRESLYPAHAHRPVAELHVPDPRAQGTFEEGWKAAREQLAANLARIRGTP